MTNLASYLLIIVRFLIGPFLFYDAYDGTTDVWFLIALTVGFLSDILDGVIARRAHTVSARLRELDGRTDVWFFAFIAASAWRTHPELVIAYRIPLLTVLGFQILAWVVDWIKYRRFSNYHAYSAKAFGLSIFATTVAWFTSSYADILIWFTVFFGMFCMLEEIAITLSLPRWVYDVPSIFHAIRIRRALLSLPQQ
jgi:phosphatidylglycerophosphate synthase